MDNHIRNSSVNKITSVMQLLTVLQLIISNLIEDICNCNYNMSEPSCYVETVDCILIVLEKVYIVLLYRISL